MIDSVFVFVYGSLMNGHRNHPVLDGALLMGPAMTAEPRRLVSLGAFPAIVEGKACSPVKGELYRVDQAILARVDHLEGHPHFYRRVPILVVTHNLVPLTAWTYVLPARYSSDTEVIRGGSWSQWLAQQRIAELS